MSRIDKRRILKNIGSSWFSLGLNIFVGIFLSPFILHRLGDSAFGIWVLIFSITGYYGLFDLGIRSSVIRYVSKYTATGENDKLARHINTSLITYCGIGLFSLAITIVLSLNISHVFRIAPQMLSQARWLMLMAGIAVSLGFPLGISGGMLEGLQRYYLLNWSNIVTTLLRAGLIVVFLQRGYGLLTVSLITVTLPVLGAIVRVAIVHHILPVPLGWRYIDRESFEQMARFSGATMLVLLAARLRFQTDEMVVGSMLSTAAITYFSIGARFSDYALQAVISLAQIFVPMSSQSEAVGNMERLRKIYIVGNRACALTAFPLVALAVILGPSMIEVWVGKKYVPLSYPVLVALMLPIGLLMMQAASSRILMGMGRQRELATVAVIEGVANLILSIALVRPLGIFGDALGTAIPLTFTMLFFLPRHMRRQLGVPVITFFKEAYSLPLLLTLPFVACLILMQRWFVPHSYRQLATQVLIAGAIYGVGVAWVVFTKRTFRVDAGIAIAPNNSMDVAVAAPGIDA